MTIMIGIDPHKATHTAVAIDDDEVVLDEFTLWASKVQASRLRDWAGRFDKPLWAVESANGLGYLLAQQLVAAGETVFDVSPVGVAGAGSGFGTLSEERHQRCPIGGDRGVTFGSAGPGPTR